MVHTRFLTAYVDLPFLETLFRNKPDPMAPPDDDTPEIWQSVFRFLQRNARIVVDADRDTLASRPLLMRFLFGTGQWTHVDLRPSMAERFVDPDEVRIDNPYALFLLQRPGIPVKRLQERTGLLFLRYEDLRADWLRLFRQHNIDVTQEAEDEFRWSHLCRHGCPLNSIVIADKYAYNQFVKGTFDQNIGALLLSMLPDHVDETVHITLITDLWRAYEDKNIKPNAIYDCIVDHLSAHRPNLKVEITVSGYEQGAGHKDRFIITNYAFFDSNHSFAFFRDGGLHRSTLVHHLPFNEDGPKVERRLRRLAVINSNPPQYPRPNDGRPLLLGSGAGLNRLLDSVAHSA